LPTIGPGNSVIPKNSIGNWKYVVTVLPKAPRICRARVDITDSVWLQYSERANSVCELRPVAWKPPVPGLWTGRAAAMHFVQLFSVDFHLL
jgi:hypothetical protein